MFSAAKLLGPADEVPHQVCGCEGGDDLPGDWRAAPDLLMKTVDDANETIAQWHRLRQGAYSPRRLLGSD
jgi:hypothetical protein